MRARRTNRPKDRARAVLRGTLGIRLVNVGQYFEIRRTALSVLQSTDATFVDFTVPQQRLKDVGVGVPVRFTDRRRIRREPLLGRDRRRRPIGRCGDRPGPIKVSASADDPGKKLRPGMFAKVAVVLPTKGAVVVVPATSLVHASYGDSVFVLEKRAADDPKPGLAARRRSSCAPASYAAISSRSRTACREAKRS